MDGINPTLAFAALFLGLSGHPREAMEDVQPRAAIVLPGAFDCAESTTVAAVPPAVPAGDPLMTDDQGMGFDLGWPESLSVLPDDSGSYREAGCDTSASQP